MSGNGIQQPIVPPSRKYQTYKLMLILGIVSIIMFFAGLTSAYIVQRGTKEWLSYSLPLIFWINTIVILISSATLHYGYRAFKIGHYSLAEGLVWLTFVLGTLFLIGQWVGWLQLTSQGVILQGTVSESFFYIISGAHAVHVLGGLGALLWLALAIRKRKVTLREVLPYQLVAIYWHFVDVLWLYLFVFFLITL